MKLFDPDFATWVKGPELVFTMEIWITTVVLDEGLNIVRGAEQGHQHKALYMLPLVILILTDSHKYSKFPFSFARYIKALGNISPYSHISGYIERKIERKTH